MPKILGIDPGKLNIAFARMNSKGVLVETGHILPLGNLTEPMFHNDIIGFENRIYRVLEKMESSRGDCIVIERFISRPGKGAFGAMSEFTNIQIGLIIGWARMLNLTVHPIAAATWKTYLQNKYYKMKGIELIDWLPSVGINPVNMSNHEVDAAGMALYWKEKIHKDQTGESVDLIPSKGKWKYVIEAHAQLKEELKFTRGLDREMKKYRKKAGKLITKNRVKKAVKAVTSENKVIS